MLAVEKRVLPVGSATPVGLCGLPGTPLTRIHWPNERRRASPVFLAPISAFRPRWIVRRRGLRRV